ncbi:MAG: mechanosensitive ion channel family protein [Crenarchaeota archaeon]|nr:mechanosensitive ion channel family protein [Thermoproteota archaeon]
MGLLPANATSLIATHLPPAEWVFRVLGAIVVMVVGILVAVLLRKVVERALYSVPKYIANIVAKTVYYGTAFAAGVTALAILGVNVSGLLFAGGLLGVAIGFASQTVVSNFLSGLFLYMDSPFKPGDPIEVEGVTGIVTDISIFSTRIRTWDGIHVRIPNDVVFRAVIRNLQYNVARRVEYKVGISYSASIDKAREVIMRVLDNHPLVLVEPRPWIFVEDLGDNAVILNVRFWVPSRYWLQVKAQLLKEIKEALDRAGIEIPFPQRVVWLHEVE